ncbi:hypothetical protein BDV96DRAFT_607199 [Lophiotrema nucula]|uniref:Heterokaryon incompatibility domain-containing protein n=1 Tax=Lophiotrema nucula TaxID=690887 RepID=A0A6A5YKP1_9PLEO|nr:hypothetical protein BDV96DRAFT_607199 [Lophiotrema nucula]
MGTIYQCAKKVHIWLGEPQAQDRISELFASFKALAMLREFPNISEAEQLDLTHDTLKSTSGGDCETQMIRFFTRSWFSRRWILQECAMNADIDVRCGEHNLAWSWFIKAISPIYSLSSSDRINLGQVSVNALDMFIIIPSALEYSMSDLLWAFPDSSCALDKDRIFALIGMAIDLHDFKHLRYANDWRKTFTQVAAMYYQSKGVAIFKHLACFGSISDPNWPSWVPDWRQEQPHCILSDEDARGGSNGWDEHFTVQSDRKLVINGWYRGSIVWKDDTTKDSVARLASCVRRNVPLGKDVTVRLLARLLWVATRDVEYQPESQIAEEDLSADGRSQELNLKSSVERALRDILESQKALTDNKTEPNSIAELILNTLDQFSLFMIGNPWWAICIGPQSTQMEHPGLRRN